MIALGIPVWIRSVIVKAGLTIIGLVINAFMTIFIETLQLKRFYGSLPSKLITLKLLALWLWKSSTTCCRGRKSTQTSFQASAVEKNSHTRLNLGLECEAEKNEGKKRPHSSAKLNLPHPLLLLLTLSLSHFQVYALTKKVSALSQAEMLLPVRVVDDQA